MTATIECDFEQFKRMAKEFHEALPTANNEQAEAGMKALGLAYLGCKHAAGLRGENERDIQAPIVLKIATQEYIKHQLRAEGA